MSTYEHRRGGAAATPFPLLQPGEISVNTYNRQIAVGDVAAATSGQPIPLLALRNFSITAQYAAGDLVVQSGIIYRAKAAISPGPFTASQWTAIANDLTGYVSKAGDTMTGALVLNADPAVALGAATRQYVDNEISAIPAPPAAATALPLMDASAVTGLSLNYARSDHVHPSDTSRAPIASPVFTGAPAGPTPVAGDVSTRLATTAFVGTAITNAAVPAPSSTTPLADGTAAVGTATAYARADHVHPAATQVLRSYLAGLTLSTPGSSTTFTVAAGQCANSSNAAMMTLAAALSKTTAAWAVGAGNGSLDTGAIANSTWYHVHLIMRVDTGVVDALVSLSPTAPTLPASYTLFRRIGSMLTNASGQWTAFTQVGDDFTWVTPVLEVNNAATVVAPTLKAIAVPTGLQMTALMQGFVQTGSTASIGVLVSSPDSGGLAAGASAGRYSFYAYSNATVASGGASSCTFTVRTNTAGQVYISSNATGGTYYLNTFGWTDRRGRDN